MSENTIAQINEPVLEFGQNLIELIVDGVPYRVGVTEEELRRIQYSDTAYEHYQEIMKYWEGDGGSNIGLKREAENARDHANAFAKMISGETLTAEERGYLSAAQQAVNGAINGSLKGLLAKYKTEVVDPWDTLKTGTIDPKVDFMEKRADSVEDFIDAFAEALNKITLNVVASGENSNVLNFDMTKPVLTLSKNEDGTIDSSASATEIQTLGTFSLDTARIPSDSYYSGSDMIVSYIYTDESTPTNFRYTPVYCKHVISNFNKQITDGDFWNIGYGKTSVSPNTSGTTISNEIKSSKLFAALGNSGSAATVNIAFNPFTVDNVSKVVGTKGFLYTQTEKMPTSGWAATSTTKALISDIKHFEQTANMNFKIKPNFDSNNGKYTGAVTVTPTPYLPSLSVPAKTGAVCGFEAYIYYVAGNIYFLTITFSDLTNVENKRPAEVRFKVLQASQELTQSEINSLAGNSFTKGSEVTFGTNKKAKVLNNSIVVKTSGSGNTFQQEVELDHVDTNGNLYYYYLIMESFGVENDSSTANINRRFYKNIPDPNTILTKVEKDSGLTYELNTDNYTITLNYNWPTLIKLKNSTSGTRCFDTTKLIAEAGKTCYKFPFSIGRTTTTTINTTKVARSGVEYVVDGDKLEARNFKMLKQNSAGTAYKYFPICPPFIWTKSSPTFDGKTCSLDIKYPYRRVKVVVLIENDTGITGSSGGKFTPTSNENIYAHIYSSKISTNDSGIETERLESVSPKTKVNENTRIYKYQWNCGGNYSCYYSDIVNVTDISELTNKIAYYDIQPNMIESKLDSISNCSLAWIGTDGKYYSYTKGNFTRCRYPLLRNPSTAADRNLSFVPRNESGHEIGPLVIFDDNDNATIIFNMKYVAKTNVVAATIAKDKVQYHTVDTSNQIVQRAISLANDITFS